MVERRRCGIKLHLLRKRVPALRASARVLIPDCGSAAAQCGKAQPFRINALSFPEAEPQELWVGERKAEGFPHCAAAKPRSSAIAVINSGVRLLGIEIRWECGREFRSKRRS